MRRAVPVVCAACLLAGPTVLAFHAGGYFTEPRVVAAIVVWLLVLAMTVVGAAPIPRSLAGWLALGGLILITAWSALSLTWAPLRGVAVENVERLVLYVGALILAIGVLRSPRAMRAVEPALAAGSTIVIGYGLAGRLLPGIVRLTDSTYALGRLEQPITYWNGEGALAAIGFVLCVRLAGDRTRQSVVRCLAAAAAPVLGVGVYLSYSRGAIAAAAIGVVIVVAAAHSRAQLRAAALALVTGFVAALCASAFPGVASLSGQLGARERDGALVLGILAVAAAAAALLTAWRAAAQGRETPRDDQLPGARRLAAVVAAVAGLVAVGLVIGGLKETAHAADIAGAKATRLTSADSNRYAYWRVGVREFRRHPLAGLGSGGFRVAWLRDRSIAGGAQDVHSLELEMAAELGLVGLLAFGLMIGGVASAARSAVRHRGPAAIGSCAAAFAWFLHASIDWDWQLPAVTLPAIVLAGALVVWAEARPQGRAASPAALGELPAVHDPVAASPRPDALPVP